MGEKKSLLMTEKTKSQTVVDVHTASGSVLLDSESAISRPL